MSRKILLITGNDDTYRRPLLEAHGYAVEAVRSERAISELAGKDFQLVLVGTESGVIDTLEMCKQMKATRPGVRVGVLAKGTETIPSGSCVDVVIRVQYSPAKFIGAINTLFETNN